MRKRIIMVWVPLAAAVVLCSEVASPAGFSAGGVKGGLSLARQHGVSWVENYRGGLGAGAFAEISVTRGISAQIELLYVQKGGESPDLELTNSAGVPISLGKAVHAVDYLELPLLVRTRVATRGPVAPTFVVGPSLAYKISEQISPNAVNEAPTEGNVFASIDFGFAIGAGLEMGRGRDRWVLEARYTVGVTDAVRDPAAANLRNRCFLVMMGYTSHP